MHPRSEAELQGWATYINRHLATAAESWDYAMLGLELLPLDRQRAVLRPFAERLGLSLNEFRELMDELGHGA